MKAVITGAKGQDGVYLAKLLSSDGIDIVSLNKDSSVDLTDFSRVRQFIKKERPDYIFHFAANSTTRHDAWKENHDTICTGSLHLLESVYHEHPFCKVFIPGSALQFVNRGKPIHETDEFEVSSAYAVSRIQSVYAARYYRSLGIPVYVGYFFNHDSPLRSERHINKRIAATAARISKGSHEKLLLGAPEVQKEFGFAGDFMDAVFLLVNQDRVYEAAIGTGKAYAVSEWARLVFEYYDLNWKDHFIKDETFRPEYEVLVSNPETIFSLGWEPRTSIEKLAEIMCEK